MLEIACDEFENRLVDYLDGSLDRQTARSFAGHALRCRNCRRILDDVKSRLRDYDASSLDANISLESSLESIPAGRWECVRFEETITEFLDGFVPPAVYQRFASHSADCESCSRLLTDVVYAVAACHSVHTYEELDVPRSLTRRLGLIGGNKVSRLSRKGLLKRMGDLLQIRLASWSALAVATWAFLIVGFSDDFTLSGVFRRAQVTAAELYTQGRSIYSKERAVDLDQLWTTDRNKGGLKPTGQ